MRVTFVHKIKTDCINLKKKTKQNGGTQSSCLGSLEDGVLRKVKIMHLIFNYYIAAIHDLGNVM